MDNIHVDRRHAVTYWSDSDRRAPPKRQASPGVWSRIEELGACGFYIECIWGSKNKGASDQGGSTPPRCLDHEGGQNTSTTAECPAARANRESWVTSGHSSASARAT